jgi:cytoskeletal protein RodZ
MAEKKETLAQGVLDMDRPGDKLRRAREALGLSLQEVATRTRVPIRQLEVVERNEFASLPGIPYAVGFARAYARAVELDEVAIASDVRAELGSDMQAARYEAFQPADPARVPPRALAWTAAIIALLIVIGYTVWRTQLLTPPADEQVATQAVTPAPVRGRAPAARPAPTDGPVVLTALDDVWLRIYDEAGERLLEKQMAKGERFTVPAGAKNPMILTGRPDALGVTVGGRAVPPLGTAERTIADFPISAAALLARPPTPAPVTAPLPAPAQ